MVIADAAAPRLDPGARFGLTVQGLRALGRVVPWGWADGEPVTPDLYRQLDEIDGAIGALQTARARRCVS